MQIYQNHQEDFQIIYASHPQPLHIHLHTQTHTYMLKFWQKPSHFQLRVILAAVTKRACFNSQTSFGKSCESLL